MQIGSRVFALGIQTKKRTLQKVTERWHLLVGNSPPNQI